MADDKNWATEYVSGPLHEPTPAEETGLISSFQQSSLHDKPNGTTSVSAQNTGSSTSTNPFRRHQPTSSRDGSPTTNRGTMAVGSSKNSTATHIRRISTESTGSSRREAFPRLKESPNGTRRSIDNSSPNGRPTNAMASVMGSNNTDTRPRRSSSLRERYPNDPSVHPLEIIRKESVKAHRSPHLRKKHHQGSDSIDKLDDAALLGAYHHAGPYDAASLARNNTLDRSAPIAALAGTNREALRATPRESVRDSIERHRPLDSIAAYPPGMTDDMGRTYQYREGPEEDMMRQPQVEGGAYKRWPGIDYLPEDLKGKGEPSYSIERGLNEHKGHTSTSSRNGNALRDGNRDSTVEGVELADRSSRRISLSTSVSDATALDGRSTGMTSGREHTTLDSHFRDRAGHDDAGIMGSAGGYEVGVPEEDISGVGTSKRTSTGQSYGEWERSHKRESSGNGLDGLKRRIGSLRRKD